MSIKMIAIKNINKEYGSKSNKVSALKNLNLKIDTSEFLLIKGESGSGKSTLLFILGAMLNPTSGIVKVDDDELFSMTEMQKATYRATKTGFVFQSYHLLPYLNVVENIMLSNKLPNINIQKEEVIRIATELGIGDRLNHKPSQLSAGEKQRVALARALVTNPSIILADEPTGNLDEKNSLEVLNYLKRFKDDGGTVVMVTHGNLADSFASRIIQLHKGELVKKDKN